MTNKKKAATAVNVNVKAESLPVIEGSILHTLETISYENTTLISSMEELMNRFNPVLNSNTIVHAEYTEVDEAASPVQQSLTRLRNQQIQMNNLLSLFEARCDL